MALTPKQEKFCIEYIKTGNKSEAYRLAYDTENMSDETIHVKANELSNNGKVRVRIEELQKDIAERNKIDIDELVQTLANIVRFDIAELYDKNDKLKSIHDIPKEQREAIEELTVLEEYQGYGKERELIGFTKKIKASGKQAAIDKLLKHLGGYEKDNRQKKTEINISDLTTEELIKRASLLNKLES